MTNQRQSDLASRGVAAQSALDQARRDYLGAQSRLIAAQRPTRCSRNSAASPTEPIEANPQYLQAKANVDRAQRDLAHTRVTAPIDGVVTNVARLQPGNYLAAAQTAFNLVSRREHVGRGQSEGNRSRACEDRRPRHRRRRRLFRPDVECESGVDHAGLGV